MHFKQLFIFLFLFSSLQAIDTTKIRWVPIIFDDFTFFIQHTGNILTLSDVKVSEITTNSTKISWSLNDYATGQIEYGETTNYGLFNVKETSFKYNTHTQPLHNLKPNTTYHYRIISEDKDGNKVVSEDYAFKTLVNEVDDREDIIQIQKDVSCEESYALATPGSLLTGKSTIVKIDIPTSTWFMGRYTFTADFTGELTVAFSGGSQTTNWWVGKECSGKEYFKEINKTVVTQTISVKDGEEVHITVFDWYHAADISLVFEREKNNTLHKRKILFTEVQRYKLLGLDETFRIVKDTGFNTVITRAKWIEGKNKIEQLLKAAAKYDIDIYILRSMREVNANLKDELLSFAKLAKTYKNFLGFTLDDLHPSRYEEKINEITDWLKEIKKVNNHFEFLPTLYFDAGKDEYGELGQLSYLAEAEPLFPNGAAMWYWASWEEEKKGRPNVSIQDFSNYIKEANSIDFSKNITYVAGVYTIRGGYLTEKKVSTPNNHRELENIFHPQNLVHDMISIALNKAPGVAVFDHGGLLIYANTKKLLENKRLFGAPDNEDKNFDIKLGANIAKISTIARTPNGWYQAIETNITLDSNTEGKIEFDIKDNISSGSHGVNGPNCKNFAYKQLVVNGKVIWGGNLYNDGKKLEHISQKILLKKGLNKIAIRILATGGGAIGNSAIYIGGISLMVKDKEKKTTNDFTFKSGIQDYSKWLNGYMEVKKALTGI